MPVFEYRGLTKDGRNTRGTLDSDNLRTARARLKKDGIFVIDIKDRTKAPAKAGARSAVSSGVNVQELSLMTRQLATLNQLALVGFVNSEEIDDLIDQWHAMPNPPCFFIYTRNF
jgi:type II secretory pathway component PulF